MRDRSRAGAEEGANIPDVLARIVERRQRRLAAEGVEDFEPPDLELENEPSSRANPFLAALRARAGRAIVAEIKLGSPRIGSLAGRVDPEAQAATYRRYGAAAISVVVEPDAFGGSYELLRRSKRAAGLPTLAKDFVVCTEQIDRAAAAGADAVLLIACLYSRSQLAAWAGYARRRGLAPLVETHDPDDLDRLGGGSWELVGVNNRNLRTFEVSLDRSIEAIGGLPPTALKVAESGIATAADVDRLAQAGFDAFLVGESLLMASDPGRLLAELAAPTELAAPAELAVPDSGSGMGSGADRDPSEPR